MRHPHMRHRGIVRTFLLIYFLIFRNIRNFAALFGAWAVMAWVKREPGENPGQTVLLCVPTESRCVPAAVSLHNAPLRWGRVGRDNG